ncbi:MAG: peroxidase [Alphaproteobacteria bacterium]|nr:peroxidase [Alphaproteobacteria bacterium]
MQGLLRSGYGALAQGSYLLLRITDAAGARVWLAQAPVTNAAAREVSNLLQVALSAGGLRALGVTEPVMAGFAPEFLSGMAGQEGRSRRLGDVGANAPARWRWGHRRVPDVLLMLAAKTDLAGWRDRVTTAAFRQGFEILEELPTSDMGGREPFGFVDGLSQPRLDWDGARRPGTAADLDYGNLIAAGEFVLGYRNEYGLYTDRPLLDAASGGAATLPPAVDDPSRRDLGRNGTYLVLRELHQDVRRFWRFMTSAAGTEAGGVALAEALVGRHLSGEPLIPGRHRLAGLGDEPGAIGSNGFVYEDDDKDGLRCPFGAHVRRANPRTADMPGGRQGTITRAIRMLGLFNPDLRGDLIASSRFHRILRRGREFGTLLTPQQAARSDVPDPQAGLHFVCLNANISRQFEFIQNAWLASAKFGGLSGESDPLTGNREPHPPGQATDGFGQPQPNGVTRRLSSLPQFVTVAGGGYFFLPGLRALRYLAGSTKDAS